jgi:hypothetical protein
MACKLNAQTLFSEAASSAVADYNDHRMAKSIENSIDFAAKRQVWQRMIL